MAPPPPLTAAPVHHVTVAPSRRRSAVENGSSDVAASNPMACTVAGLLAVKVYEQLAPAT